MLELAAVLALSARCAPSVAPETLAAIAWVESRFDPLAIGINGPGARPPRSSNRAEAGRHARRLLAGGANVDLGLAQINSDNLDWLGLTVEEAFDPCRSLAAAATVLRAGYRPTGDTVQARQTALRVALSRYNTGDAVHGFRNGYVARVERAAARLNLTRASPLTIAPAPEGRTPLEDRPAPLPAWDVFAHAHGPLVFTPQSAGSPR